MVDAALGGWGDDVDGHALDAGHFFPEAAPEQTAEALQRFFGMARTLRRASCSATSKNDPR